MSAQVREGEGKQIYPRDVCIRVQAEHLRGVCICQAVDMLVEFSDLGAFGNDVPLVEDKLLLEHGLSKPDFAERVQQSLVIVISDSTTILDLAKHISNTSPVDALQDAGSRMM